MSKSLGNYIGISEPPNEMFGKLMSISDDLMWRYFELLSFETVSKINHYKKTVSEGGANPRDIKYELAKEIVERFHGKAAANNAMRDFIALHINREIPEDMPEHEIRVEPGGIAIGALLKQCNLTASVSEANRLVEQGGVRVDGEKVSDRTLKLKAGKSYVLQIGKRKFARMHLQRKSK